jgi:N-acetylglucosamine kinase-like BadF-type ATPase
MAERQLILGVDGGGTKTQVRIAAVADDAGIEVLGEGRGGPSNAAVVGIEAAVANLDEAVDAAHLAAGTQNETIDYAVVALAGAGLPGLRSSIAAWAEKRGLAKGLDVVNDLEPVLAAGLANKQGVAVIVGTGSSVVGEDEAGDRCEAGGWGYWIGDEGSAFDLGRRSLAAVADAVDGVGPQTMLVERVTERLHTDDPRDLRQALGGAGDTHRMIASLAGLLINAVEEGDAVAASHLDEAVDGIARQVVAASRNLQLDATAPLAVAGGVVCSSEIYREALLERLRKLGLEPRDVVVVDEPVDGSLVIARDRLLAR